MCANKHRGRCHTMHYWQLPLLLLLTGGMIEILQHYFFTWRSGEWDELFADVIGVLMETFRIFITAKE